MRHESEPVIGPSPKPFDQYTLVGKPPRCKDQRNHITGKTKFCWDLDVPGAKPAIVARAPQVRGTVEDFDEGALRAMPGVIDVARIPTGIAIVAETFGQALAAQKAIKAEYGRRGVDGLSDSDIRKKLRAAAPPPTALPLGAGLTPGQLDAEFDWAFVNHAALEPNSAVADVRQDSAEIWSELKTPIIAQATIAKAVGLPVAKVTVHVVRGGGSFGRRLFFDGALEAAQISKALRRPVKPINPRGLEAQMLSGLNDGISTVLYAGNHLDNGAFRETSYTDFGYAKQRHYPTNVETYVMPKTIDEPGGAGETTVSAAGGAIANAYARATGTKPRSFPINF